MFLVGPYLFSGDSLEEYLNGRRAEAEEAARAVTAEEVAAKGRNNLLRELHKRFAVPSTAMHVDRAYFEGERPLSQDEREAIGVKPKDAGRHKAISICIPYSGDPHLLTCTPTVYSANQPQAEVRAEDLLVTYLLNEIEEFQLENNFKRQVALIERTLEVTQWQAMAYNEKLMDVLSEALPVPAGA